MKFIISVIVFGLILIGCSEKDKVCIPQSNISDNSEECSKVYYNGYLKFVITSNLYESSSSLLIFNIGSRECFATTYSEPIFQANRVKVMFDSMDCGFEKPIKVKGYVLDKDCMFSVPAKYMINNKSVKYLENRVKNFGGKDEYREYLKAKNGWLETESNRQVFVNIYEPSSFLFKNKLNFERIDSIRSKE